jgi:hypothetical protein
MPRSLLPSTSYLNIYHISFRSRYSINTSLVCWLVCHSWLITEVIGYKWLERVLSVEINQKAFSLSKLVSSLLRLILSSKKCMAIVV